LEDGEGGTFGVVEDSDTSHVEQVEGLYGDRGPQLGCPSGCDVGIRDREVDHPMRRDVLRPQLVHLHHAGDSPIDTREEEDRVARSFREGRDPRFDYRLLSDTDKRIAKAFGVKRPGPLFSKRSTFGIDQDRHILATISSEINMDKHADEALAVLRARQ